jgi:hypothetical protein
VSGWFQKQGVPTSWSNLGTIFTTSSNLHSPYGNPGVWLFSNSKDLSYQQTYQYGKGIGGGAKLPYDENWHFFALVFDKESGNKCYVDGVNMEKEKVIPYDYTSSLPFTVGNGYHRYSWTGNFYFIGNIDDIRVYSRVLTESEVQALYNE